MVLRAVAYRCCVFSGRSGFSNSVHLWSGLLGCYEEMFGEICGGGGFVAGRGGWWWRDVAGGD